MKITIVIPLYNEEKHIAQVLMDLSVYKLPIVVVDDGSTDSSWSKVKGVTLLEHKINLGKGAAMKTGAEYAFENGSDAVIFMDSDGQHAAEDLPKFIKVLEKGEHDVVLGSRNLNFEVPIVRYMGNKLASVFVNLLYGIYISDLLCGFRAVSKRGYEKIEWESTGYGVETEMVVKTALSKAKYVEVPVETIYHDKVKGVTLLDAFGILFSVLKWRLRIK